MPGNVAAVLAVLKRRWILLLCAMVLVGCTTFDRYVNAGGQGWHKDYGLQRGAFFFEKGPPLSFPYMMEYRHLETKLHLWPDFGRFPRAGWHDSNYLWVVIPLWLPLSAVIGWLVWRELRWREKRVKAADAAIA